MTAIIEVTDHANQALSRLLNHYRGRPKLERFITAHGDEIQQLESAAFDLIIGRALQTAVGAQLDLIGTLVDQERGSFDDDFYRILLSVKIGQNTSQGNSQKITDVFKILTQADFVHNINLGGAAIQLNTTGIIDDDEVDFIFLNMERVVAGGVRIDHIVQFEVPDSFAFSGFNALAPGGGFNDVADTAPNAGSFAKLLRQTIPFAFSGNDLGAEGFGGLGDPLAGGKFQPIGGF